MAIFLSKSGGDLMQAGGIILVLGLAYVLLPVLLNK